MLNSKIYLNIPTVCSVFLALTFGPLIKSRRKHCEPNFTETYKIANGKNNIVSFTTSTPIPRVKMQCLNFDTAKARTQHDYNTFGKPAVVYYPQL